jgi:hypothetical protein
MISLGIKKIGDKKLLNRGFEQYLGDYTTQYVWGL